LKLCRDFLLMAVKGIAGLALAAAILWQVVQHSGPRKGTAYVHASATDVDVMVDDVTYHIASFDDIPIVCELDPGKHTLRMTRNEQILYEEEFTVPIGGEVVVAAHGHADSASLAPASSVDPESRRRLESLRKLRHSGPSATTYQGGG
jgi:hypothetical protein